MSGRSRSFWRQLRKWARKRRARKSSLKYYSNVEIRIDGLLYEGVNAVAWEWKR